MAKAVITMGLNISSRLFKTVSLPKPLGYIFLADSCFISEMPFLKKTKAYYFLSTYNTSLNTYNVSLNTYNASLSTYNGSLNTYNASLNTYNASLSTYNASLTTYNALLHTYNGLLKTCNFGLFNTIRQKDGSNNLIKQPFFFIKPFS